MNVETLYPPIMVGTVCRSFEEALKQGGYSWVNPDITADKVGQVCMIRREIHVVPPDPDLWAREGWQLCRNGVWPLLDLMVLFETDPFLKELCGFDIVAAEPKNPASIFGGHSGAPSHICVRQSLTLPEFKRGLDFTPVRGGWKGWDSRWRVLVEKISQ
ncbi:MAG: hypothetical protein PHS53_04895 [Candidatus Pacebacteria bacterium]|nr:hypothetical protein [Candidatus Paceibacterota bacterium]MDD5357450.1 hypothetical protein [Candidatus Paceibacterota bacterium]